MAKDSVKTLTVTQEDNVLVIRIPMQKPAPSSSGKTLVVATTHGNQATTVEVNEKPVIVGVNAYIRAA